MKDSKKDSTHHSEHDQLRDLLNQHTKALCEEAIQADGHVSGRQLEALGRLARLVELSAITRPVSPWARWPVVALLGATLVIVSILLFARVSSTEIELDLSLTEVSFRLPQQQVLAEEMRLSSLGVSGMQQIQLPRSQTRAAQVIQAPDGSGTALRLTPILKNQQGGSVTLAAIILPAGTRISLRTTEVAQQYRLTIQGGGPDLQAGVQGPIEIGRPGTPPEQVNFVSPQAVLLPSGHQDIDLDIRPLTATKTAFSRQLLADSLSLFRVDEQVTAEHTVVRRISTVLSGTLYFESLGGKERRIRPGQEIRFESSAGEIRTLALKEDHIAFSFHGRVGGMTVGGDKNRISLMPTYLEWLSARHGLSLFWGTTLYIFGLIFSVMRWWRASS